MRMMKMLGLAALALFLAYGAALLCLTGSHQSQPELARAAYMMALCPAMTAFLCAREARRLYKPDHT